MNEKEGRRPQLFNMSSFQTSHGLDRMWVSGFVCGAGLPTYRGKKNSLNVDEAGREQIISKARDWGLISA